jgi:hypothetical protein
MWCPFTENADDVVTGVEGVVTGLPIESFSQNGAKISNESNTLITYQSPLDLTAWNQSFTASIDLTWTVISIANTHVLTFGTNGDGTCFCLFSPRVGEIQAGVYHAIELPGFIPSRLIDVLQLIGVSSRRKIAITYDAVTKVVQFYMNASLMGSAVMTNFPTIDNTINIGITNLLPVSYYGFGGYVRDFKLFDVVLTDNEIASL